MKKRVWFVIAAPLFACLFMLTSLFYSVGIGSAVLNLDPEVLRKNQMIGYLSTDDLIKQNPLESKSPITSVDGLYEVEYREPSEILVQNLTERFLRRKKIQTRACELLKNHTLSPHNSEVFRAEPYIHLMVSKEKQILYCYLPKVANTNFRRVFLGIKGVVPAEAVSDISGEDVYFKLDKEFKYLNEFDVPERTEMLQNYKKFVFVREPLERLLSAYRNKFFHPKPIHKAEYHNRAISFYTRHRDLQQAHRMRQSFSDKEMTFEEFLTYWTDIYDVKEYSNEHFVPAIQLCNPCAIDYDYIGKYEEIGDEVKFIFDKSNIDIAFPGRNDNYSSVVTSTIIDEYYKPIPDWLLKKTWDILKFDYVLFNYRLPDWFNERLRHRH